MNDTGTLSIPARLRVLESTATEIPTTWQRALVSSLEEAETRIDELRAAGREHQLVVLGPGVFAIEWR